VDAAIGRHHVIALGDQLRERGGDRLLPRHRPVGEQELAGGHAGLDRLVDGADARHLAIDLDQNRRLDAHACAHFIVGIENCAPRSGSRGQRCVTAFKRV